MNADILELSEIVYCDLPPPYNMKFAATLPLISMSCHGEWHMVCHPKRMKFSVQCYFDVTSARAWAVSWVAVHCLLSGFDTCPH